MWSTEKALSSLITNVLVNNKFEQFQLFQDELNAKYLHFLDILKDPPPALNEREKVKRGNEGDGVQINYLRQSKRLTKSMIEEALTLSDLFGLSEMAAVELLVEAEEQMQYFHGFNRGLTAVLLYYDSKKVAVNSLKTLILARSGRNWVLDENMPSEVVKFVDEFVNKLIQNGLVSKILAQIGLNDWQKAEESLNRVNGLGNLKHRKQVKNLFEEIKVTMAECLFDCACQIPFNLKDTLAVIQFLKLNCNQPVTTVSIAPATTTTTANTNPTQSTKSAPIDTSHLYLVMALLYSFDCSYMENKEKSETIKLMDRYLKEGGYIKAIYKELTKSDNSEWVAVGVKSVLQFAFQIFLTLLNGYIIDNDFSIDLQWIGSDLNGLEEDESLIDSAIQLHVFSFIRSAIVQHEKFHNEFYNESTPSDPLTQRVDEMQSRFKCCGRDSFLDWQSSSSVNPSKKFLFLNNKFLLHKEQLSFNVPDSCCARVYESCGKDMPMLDSIFTRGCLPPLKKFLDNLLFYVYASYLATFCVITSSIVYFLYVSLAVNSEYYLLKTTPNTPNSELFSK